MRQRLRLGLRLEYTIHMAGVRFFKIHRVAGHMSDSDKTEKFTVENVLDASIRAWSVLVEVLADSGNLDRRVLCEKFKSDMDKIDGKADARTIVAMRRFLIHVLNKPGAADSFSKLGAMLQQEPLEPPKEYPRPQHFNIRFGDALLEHLESQSAVPMMAGAVPGFSEASVDGNEDILILGFHESALARDQGPFQLFESSGVHFFIPQIKLKKKLMGKTVDIENGRLFIVDERR